jgi:ACS family tartrate transporter-like MFS transporter
MSFFMPQEIKSLSEEYSNFTVGLLALVPQLVGLAGMVLVSRSSDRRLERRYHAAIPLVIAGVALLGLTTTSSPPLVVAVLSIMAAGIYGFIGPFFSMPSEFLTGYSAASGIALINSVANVGAFVGLYLIGFIGDKTAGLEGGMVFTAVSLFLSATLALLLPRRRTG